MRADAVTAAGIERARSQKTLSAEEERKQLLAEIRDDIAVACPEYRELTQTLRNFAARHLVVEEPRGLLLGILSAAGGEGRTTVSLGLAGALADLCPNVVLVEMGQDADQPTLTEELGLSDSSGLAGVLQNGVSLEDVVQPTSKSNLWVLPAGQNGQQPGRLLGSSTTGVLLSKLRERYAVSLFDVPALLADDEAPAFIGQLDGAVLVVAAGRTTIDDVNEAAALLGEVPLRGVLLNRLHQYAPRWMASLLEV